MPRKDRSQESGAEEEDAVAIQADLTGPRKDDEPGRSEADGLSGGECGEQAEQLSAENRAPGDRLGEEQLRRAAFGPQSEHADDQRRQRRQQQDELDE
jgi:hypothetical protein